jgi:hypothetical protein
MGFSNSGILGGDSGEFIGGLVTCNHPVGKKPKLLVGRSDMRGRGDFENHN